MKKIQKDQKTRAQVFFGHPSRSGKFETCLSELYKSLIYNDFMAFFEAQIPSTAYLAGPSTARREFDECATSFSTKKQAPAIR